MPRDEVWGVFVITKTLESLFPTSGGGGGSVCGVLGKLVSPFRFKLNLRGISQGKSWRILNLNISSFCVSLSNLKNGRK